MAARGYTARRLGLELGGRILDGTRRDIRSVLRIRRAQRRGQETGGAELTDFDPLAPEVIRDPYPWYRELLAGQPLKFSARRRVWIVSRYEDVRAAAQAHGTLSSAEGIISVRRPLPMLLAMDRPEHTRLRRIAARQFTHEALDRRRETIEAIVTAAVDRAVAAGEFDAVDEIAMPVPVDVIAELLGVPRSDRRRFHDWSDRIVVGFSLAPGNYMRASATVLPAIFRLQAYLNRILASRREQATDDLLGHLLSSSEEGRMTEEELFWFALLLLVAGNETTTSLLGTLLFTLAGQPEAFQRLREQPELIPSAVEEGLRLHSPVQATYRTATEPYRVGDSTVPAGGRIMLALGASNRDPAKYPDPETFVVDRHPSDHLAFGSGIHFCLGAHLARLEVATVLRRLIQSGDGLELAGQPAWTHNPSLRGMQSVPLRLRPVAEPAARAAG